MLLRESEAAFKRKWSLEGKYIGPLPSLELPRVTKRLPKTKPGVWRLVAYAMGNGFWVHSRQYPEPNSSRPLLCTKTALWQIHSPFAAYHSVVIVDVYVELQQLQVLYRVTWFAIASCSHERHCDGTRGWVSSNQIKFYFSTTGNSRHNTRHP